MLLAMKGVVMLDSSRLRALLSYPSLIDELQDAFSHINEYCVPSRHHHAVAREDGSNPGTLLLMPAWFQGDSSSSASSCSSSSHGACLGVKMVTVFPDNGTKGLPAVAGLYILSSRETGQPLACIDGSELTLWRTASASALAARYLARKDAEVLAMVGAGALAPHLIRAHLAVNPSLTREMVWNRTRSRAARLVESLRACGLEVELEVQVDLEAAVRAADVVSCATLSQEALVQGAWLKPGAHLDLVGSFTPSMRECDDEALRVGTVFVDTLAAVRDAGELVQSVRDVATARDHVKGTLADLCQGLKPGRQSVQEITVFKSVGFALEDLVAAGLVFEKHMESSSRT